MHGDDIHRKWSLYNERNSVHSLFLKDDSIFFFSKALLYSAIYTQRFIILCMQ